MAASVTRYAAAALSVGIAYFLEIAISPELARKIPFFLFVFAVMFSAAFGGRGPGFFSAALSVIVVDFAFLGLPFSFAGTDNWEFTRACIFLVLGIVITLTLDHIRSAYENLHRTASALEQANTHLQAAQDRLISANEELQRSQDSLFKANARLKQSNEDLQQFAYSVSHDLQSPLRTIASFCQLLARRYRGKLDGDADELLDHIDSGLGRMTALVRDLLEYSKVTHSDADAWIETDCNEIVRDVLKDCEAHIQETAAVIVADSLPTVNADPILMSQVFRNLIENGLKYRSSQPPEITISAKPEDGLWVFSVADNGIGFDMSHADLIFNVFARLHAEGSAYKGTGIGLAIVKKIVERRGGSIWVESQPDKGSTFYFTVPSTPGRISL
ncbi:MAG: ATP-binding protein [Bryobacteraceae bacterium]